MSDKTTPTTSWWLDLKTHAELREAVEREQARMRNAPPMYAPMYDGALATPKRGDVNGARA